MKDTIEIEMNLSQFSGTEQYHRNPFHGKFLYSDGVRYLAEAAGAYWLLDLLASYQPQLAKHKDQRLHQMQFWNLKINPDHSATATCRADSDVPPAVTQQIEFSDFPLPEIDIWVIQDQLGMLAILKTEY